MLLHLHSDPYHQTLQQASSANSLVNLGRKLIQNNPYLSNHSFSNYSHIPIYCEFLGKAFNCTVYRGNGKSGYN